MLCRANYHPQRTRFQSESIINFRFEICRNPCLASLQRAPEDRILEKVLNLPNRSWEVQQNSKISSQFRNRCALTTLAKQSGNVPLLPIFAFKQKSNYPLYCWGIRIFLSLLSNLILPTQSRLELTSNMLRNLRRSSRVHKPHLPRILCPLSLSPNC